MKTSSFAAGLLAVVAFASLGEAADLPRRSEAPPVTWTGFYFGGHGGYATGRWRGPLGYDDPAFPGITAADIFDPVDRNMSGKGAIVGGQIGVNYQIGALVIGLEADGAGADIKDSDSFTTVDKNTTWNVTTEVIWLATVRARVGVAFDRLLIYGTGGGAWGGTDGNNQVTCVGCPKAPWATGKSSATHSGWAAGGGVEYLLFSNWTIRAEYLYIDLGRAAQRFDGTAFSGLPEDEISPGRYRYRTDSYHPALRFHAARVGLNLRF